MDKDVLAELTAMKGLYDYPNIIKLLDLSPECMEGRLKPQELTYIKTTTLYLIFMEFCRGGSLQDEFY